jgi:hypothetical protein
MDAPPVRSGTSATVEAIPYYGLNGETVAIVLIKERFEAHPSSAVTRLGGAEVRYIDEPWDPDNPEISSIKYPSDICLAKPSTDVIVVGSAMTRDRVPVRELDVLVRVGPVEKALRVFGLRVWYRGLTGLTMTNPEPFEALPMRWESAYGGSDFTEGQKPLEEPRNPVGRGVARSPNMLVHEPAPQIEDPRDLIHSHRSRPAPAGVGAIGRHWEPRRRYVGTIDERWMEERMPLLPLDHDPRFNQVATPELITPRPLSGGEDVRVLNMNDRAPLDFELPMIRFHVGSATSAHGEREHRPVLDTVLLEPNERRFELTWRSIVPLPRRPRDLHSITVYEKSVGGLP